LTTKSWRIFDRLAAIRDTSFMPSSGLFWACHRETNYAPRDYDQVVTAEIIAVLEAGTPPWRGRGIQGRRPAMPRNASTVGPGVPRRRPALGGIQGAEDRGWQVRRGERGTAEYFFKRLELRDDSRPQDEEETARSIPLLRAFTLFHVSQIDGIPAYVRAFYSPTTVTSLCRRERHLPQPGGYCGVLIYEMSHRTSAPSRLNRDLRNSFGSNLYARQELRAEIGQVTVCVELGIADVDFSNNAAYVASWRSCARTVRRSSARWPMHNARPTTCSLSTLTARPARLDCRRAFWARFVALEADELCPDRTATCAGRCGRDHVLQVVNGPGN
jgi:antirestriction protein ArdC